MRTLTAGLAERRPPPSRPDDPAGLLRRGELAAGLATAVIVGQLVLAPLILCAAAVFVVTGRLSRWRPHWLAAPIIASLLWLRADGLGPAAAGVAEGARRTSALLLVAAVHPSRLAHSVAVVAGAATWLPRQLPLAMLAGAGEAGLVLWLGWWRRTAQLEWRPGLVAALRRRAAVRDLTAGHTVSVDGCTLGVVTDTGKLASLSWAEVARGVMLAGPDAGEIGLAVICAALRLRKTVVIVGADRGTGIASRVRDLARSLGVPTAEIGLGSGEAAADTAAIIGQAIRGRTLALVMTPTVAAVERAVADLNRVLADLRGLGLRADCIAWLADCAVDSSAVSELLALGQQTGTAVLLSTANPEIASSMTCDAGVGSIVVSGPIAIGRQSALAAQLGAAGATWRPISQERGQFTVITRFEPPDTAPRNTTGCVVVPITAEPQR